MKRASPTRIALVFLATLFVTGVWGCGPKITPAAPASPTAAAPTSPAVSQPASNPTSEPAGDGFDVVGFIPQYGILIDSVEEDAAQISIRWWSCLSDGFVQSNFISSSKTAAGRENPQVFIASPDEHRALIADWQKKGYTAQITDLDGATRDVSNIFLLYRPPLGYQWAFPYGDAHESVLRVVVDGIEQPFHFGRISDLTVTDGAVELTLRDGEKLAGVWQPPTQDSTAYLVSLVGVQPDSEGRLIQFDIPFQSVRSIVFVAAPAG